MSGESVQGFSAQQKERESFSHEVVYHSDHVSFIFTIL